MHGRNHQIIHFKLLLVPLADVHRKSDHAQTASILLSTYVEGPILSNLLEFVENDGTNPRHEEHANHDVMIRLVG